MDSEDLLLKKLWWPQGTRHNLQQHQSIDLGLLHRWEQTAEGFQELGERLEAVLVGAEGLGRSLKQCRCYSVNYNINFFNYWLYKTFRKIKAGCIIFCKYRAQSAFSLPYSQILWLPYRTNHKDDRNSHRKMAMKLAKREEPSTETPNTSFLDLEDKKFAENIYLHNRIT